MAAARLDSTSPSTSSTAQTYLQVGVGAFTGGFYINGGTPSTSTVENVVSVAMTPANFGTGALPMTSDSPVTTSFYDGATVCSGAGARVYVGGYYRNTAGGAASAPLTVTSPANLVSAQGGTIPFGKISWTTGIDRVPDVVQMASGRFVGGTTQTLAAVAKNTWFEDCFSFTFDNADSTLLAGTYTGQVIYTLTAP